MFQITRMNKRLAGFLLPKCDTATGKYRCAMKLYLVGASFTIYLLREQTKRFMKIRTPH